MQLRATPSDHWDERAGSAWLSTGFAAASAVTGHHALYAEDHDDLALVLLRSIPLPILHRCTLRAKVFVARRDGAFLRRLIDRLADLGVVCARIGDHRHPWMGAWPVPWRLFRSEQLWSSMLDDVQKTPAEFLATRRGVRQNLAKAERAAVEVVDVISAKHINAFCALIAETDIRMTRHGVNHIYPQGFFRAVRQHMVPRGQAVMLIAHAAGTPLAAQLYFVSPDRLSYYHGGSTRNRALTPKQGPTAVTWRAISIARERGHALLDLGGINPGDEQQVGVTQAKRQWATRPVAADVGEIVLAPRIARMQRSLLLPLWKYAHPLYIRAFGRRTG